MRRGKTRRLIGITEGDVNNGPLDPNSRQWLTTPHPETRSQPAASPTVKKVVNEIRPACKYGPPSTVRYVK